MYRLFLSDFNDTWIFSTDIWKKTRISIFMKIRPLGYELFYTDGQTGRDMKKITGAFRTFASAPKSTEYHTILQEW